MGCQCFIDDVGGFCPFTVELLGNDAVRKHRFYRIRKMVSNKKRYIMFDHQVCENRLCDTTLYSKEVVDPPSRLDTVGVLEMEPSFCLCEGVSLCLFMSFLPP